MTGLYYYRYRDYNPQTGRFLQPDPLGQLPGPNIYSYCQNNPVNWVDPWGLFGLNDMYEAFQNQQVGSQGPADNQYEKNVKNYIENNYDPEWIEGEGGIDEIWRKYNSGGLNPWTNEPVPIDTDGDGIVNPYDDDADNDGIRNYDDKTPYGEKTNDTKNNRVKSQ